MKVPELPDKERLEPRYNKIIHHLAGEPYDVALSVLATMLVFGLMHEGRGDDYVETPEDRRDACLWLSKFFADKATEAMN
jgi:hypothetical protein